ncbi:MAG: phage tail tape measure protein, partial [Faecalibacterium longum]|nr:phage tail tape measure protein [Faecalibacterium prausnitzii]MDY5550449.1 phage tail tape measure protein [Faecalibacterium longum]
MADYSITGDTKLDTSGFTKGISSMTVAAGNLISDLTKTAATKLAGLAKSSVSVGMNFDKSMSQVAATMGKSVDEIDNLTRVAKEMGSTTKFTATQAADALNYLALAGYDADKAAEVLPSVLNLAAAGGMDLAYASDLVTDAMASLNIEANKQNVDDFGNKLAKAASKANANVSQLGEAILTVGGTAANLKGGTTELTTALGLLANVGIKGAEGGTHLRNIILSLQSPTDDATKLMQKLGLQVYDAQGNMRGLNDILGDLNGALDGMTQGQKDSIINQLFNKTDLAAVNGLLAAQGEQWDTLAAQIDSADGAMGQMAETQQDNLQGVMTSLGSAFEGLKLAVYNELEPSLTDLGNYGIECVRTLTAALSEGGPEAMLQAAGEIISDLAAGIAEQLPGLMQSGVDIITQLTQSLSDAMPAMLDTGAQVLGALVQGLSDSIPQLLSSAVQIISDFALYLADNADAIYDGGLQLLESLVVGITDNLPQLITAAAVLIARFVAAFISHLPKILECAGAMLTTLVDGIVRGAENLAEAALACVAELLGVWDGSMDDWGSIGVNIVKGIQDGILSWWDNLVSSVQEKVNGMISTVKSLLGIHSPSKVFSEIGLNICRGLAEGLTTNEPLAEDAAKQVVASVTHTTEALTGSMQTVTKTVTEILKDGTETQKQVITEVYDDVVDGALVTVEKIKTVAADGTVQVAEQIKKSSADTFDGLWKELQEKANDGVLGTFDDLYSAVKDKDWKSIGLWVAKTIYGGLTADQKKQIEDYALGLVGKINGVLGQYQQQIAAKAWDIGTQICSGLTNGFADVWQQAQGLGSTLMEIFGGLKTPLSNAALAISQGMKGGLISAFPEILASLGSLIGSIGGAFVAMLDAI